MKMHHLLPSLIFLSCFTWSCGPDNSNLETEQALLGKWELEKGYRNGKSTQTLEGTFFEFLPEKKVVYNLSGAREEVAYEFLGEAIKPVGSRLDATYDIAELSDTSLILTATIRDFPFRFEMKKTSSISK